MGNLESKCSLETYEWSLVDFEEWGKLEEDEK